MQRFSELNKQMIDKIKDLEGQLITTQPSQNLTSEEEVNKLRKDLEKAKLETK